MIINPSEYNPLEVILKYNLTEGCISAEDLAIIRKELFSAGIVPENAQELSHVLEELRQLRNRFYGKK